MKNEPIQIEQEVDVGRNSHGYTFHVGLLSGYWLGYAQGAETIFLFPGIRTGHQLGILDRDEAIRRVGAIAQDPASGYGGIEEWSVEESLRGDPAAYLCPVCDEVCCGEDHSDEDSDYSQDFPI